VRTVARLLVETLGDVGWNVDRVWLAELDVLAVRVKSLML
jgi:hypothetical protein